MKLNSLRGFLAATFILFCISTSLYASTTLLPTSKNYTSDQELHSNQNIALPVELAANPGDGIEYKSNAGTNLILQTIIDTVLGVVLTSAQNSNRSIKIPLSFGPIEFEFGVKISWIDNPGASAKDVMVEFEGLNNNPFTFSGGFELLGNLMGTPGARISGLSLKSVFNPTVEGALKFRYNQLAKTVTDIQVLNDWSIKYDIQITGALSRALITAISPPAASLCESIDKLLPSDSKLSNFAVAGGSLSAELKTSSLDAMTTFTLGGNLSTNASLEGKEILRGSIAPSILLKWGKDQGGSYYEPTGKISADVNLDFCVLTYSKTWDIITWQNDKTYDIVRIKAPVLQLSSRDPIRGKALNVSTVLEAELGGPFAGQIVNFQYYNGAWITFASAMTQANGLASSSWVVSPNVGAYPIRVYYYGNTRYQSCYSEESTLFVVGEQVKLVSPTFNNNITYYMAGEVFSASAYLKTISDTPLESETVRFYYSGDRNTTWTEIGNDLTDGNGLAQLSTSFAPASGVYYFVAMFGGSSQYGKYSESLYHEITVINNRTLIISPDPLQGLRVERGVNKTYVLHVDNFDLSPHLCNFTYNASGSTWFIPYEDSAIISALSGYNFWVNVCVPVSASIQAYTGNFTIYRDNVFYRNFSYQFEVCDFQTASNFPHTGQTLTGSHPNNKSFDDLNPTQKTLYSTCLKEILVNVTFTTSAPSLIGTTMTANFKVGSSMYGMSLQHGSGTIAPGANEFWFYLKEGDANMVCRNYLPGNTTAISLPISGGTDTVSSVTIMISYRTESLVKVTSLFDGGKFNLTVNRGDDIKINWRAQADSFEVLSASLLFQHPAEFNYITGTFGVDPVTAQSLGNLSYGKVNSSYGIYRCNVAGIYYIPYTLVTYNAFPDDARAAYDHMSYSGALMVKVVGSFSDQDSLVPTNTVTEDEPIEIKYYAQDDTTPVGLKGLLVFINITKPDATNMTFTMNPITGSPGWYHVLYKPDQDGTYTYFILAKNDATSLQTEAGSFSATGMIEMGAHCEARDQRAIEFTVGDNISAEIFTWHDGVLETPVGTMTATLKYPTGTTRVIAVSIVGTGRYRAVMNLSSYYDLYGWVPEQGWYEVNFTHSGTGWVTQSNNTFFYVGNPQIFIERSSPQIILHQRDFLLNFTVRPTLLSSNVQVFLDNISKGNLASPTVFYNLTEGWHSFYLSCSDRFGYAGNQSVSFYVMAQPVPETLTLFEEDFEHGLEEWSTTGLWHLTSNISNTDPFLSPVHAAWCGREDTGTYNSGSRVWDNLTSPIIDLKRVTNAMLRFSMRYNVETGTGNDIATVLVSTNGINYVSVYTRSSPNQAPSWTDISVNLLSYIGKTIRIRFMFDTVNAAANDYQGWLVDNVRVTTTTWQDASLSSVKIGALIAYGSANPLTQYPSAVSLLTSRLATTASISQSLNLSLLQQYSILWIDENGTSMPRADLEALMTWVYQGGSLISSGDNFGTMNAILNYLNISTVSSAAAGGNYSNFTLHDVTEGLTTIYHQDPGCSLNLSLYPYPNEIFPTVMQEGYVQGAAGWYGNGKLVITCDEDPFLNPASQQNTLYINKIFGWLSNSTPPEDLLPPSYSLVAVTPDPGMEGSYHINATIFDKSGITSAIARVRSLCNNVSTVILYDDGLHGDGIAGDFQYGGNYTTKFDDVGLRYLDLQIIDASTRANVQNTTGITTFVVQPGTIPRIHSISQNATFDFVAGGTEFHLTDNGYLQLTLPFAFPFYNATYSSVYISNNGWMSFSTSDPSEGVNVAFPSTDARYAHAIAPYWNDIAATTTYGSILAANLTFPGNHRAWVVTWQDVYHVGAGSCGTFQVILYESGEVKLQFLVMNDVLANGGYTSGLNLGSNSYASSFSGLVDGTNNTAILFTPIKETTPPASVSMFVATPLSWTNSSSFNVSWTNPWDYSHIGAAFYKVDSVPTSNNDGTLVTGYDLTQITGITVGSTGTHPIYVWVVDQANNTDYTTCVSINLYYDGVLPNNPTGCIQGNGLTLNGTWQDTVNDPDFTWNGASDDHSGVAGYYYYWGTETAGTASDYTTFAAYNPPAVSGSGIYYLRVQTNDSASNLAAWTTIYEFRYDETAPTNPTGCTQANGTTTSSVWQHGTSDPNFTWGGATDTHSGVAGYLYYWGTDLAGTGTSYTTSASFDPASVGISDIYYLRVRTNDSVGNLATAWTTIYELWYDGDAPANPTGCSQLEGSTTNATWQNTVNDANFTWGGATDTLSGVAGYNYYWGEESEGTSTSYTTSAVFDPSILGSSGTYYLRVQTNDTAGNLAAWITLYEFKYDGIRPTNPTGCSQTNGTTTSGAWQNSTSDANFTWSGATDTLSGVAGYLCYWGPNPSGTSTYFTVSASYDPGAVGSGTYYLRVLTNDTAGNWAIDWKDLYTFKYDGDAPTNPTGCSQTNGTSLNGVWQNSTSDANFTWSGATDTLSGVGGYYYYWGNDANGTSISYTSDSTYNPPAVGGSGVYYLRVRTNDSVGNLAGWITLYEFRYDTSPPTNPTGCVQTVGSMTSGVWQNLVSHPYFTWSGALDTHSGVAGYFYYFDTNATGTSPSYTPIAECDTGSVSGSGIYYFRIQTQDAAGNLVAWITLYEFWYDITPPNNPTGCIQINGSTASGVWQNTTNDPNFTWSGASDGHSGVARYYYYWGLNAIGTSTTYYTTTEGYDPDAVSGSGKYYLRVLTNDSVGNPSAVWVTLYEFWYDYTAPNNPTTCTQTNPTTTNATWQNTVHDPYFSWSGATDADSGVAGYYIYWGTEPTGTSTNYQTSTLFDAPDVGGCGIHYLRVQTNDSVGNLAATWTTLYEFRYDNVAPDNPVSCDQTRAPTTSGVWQNVENHPIFSWSGATDVDSGVAGYYYYWGTNPTGTIANYRTSASYDPGAINSETYYFRVQTRDAANNLASWVTLYVFRYDGTPPTNPIACIQSNGSTTSGEWQSTVNDANFTWSGASDAHTGVAGYLYYWGTSATGTSTSYTTSASYDPEQVGYGTYYLRVRTNDSVGNLATQWVTLYVFKYDQSYVPPPTEPPVDYTIYIVIFLVIGAVITVFALIVRRPKTAPSKGRKLEAIAAKRLKAQQKKPPSETDRGRALFEATREPIPTPGQPISQPSPQPTAPTPQPKVMAPPVEEEPASTMTEEGLYAPAFATSCQFCGETIQDGKCPFCGAWVCKHCGTTNTPVIDKCAKCEKFRWG